MYTSLFLPYVNYGILLWGSNAKRIIRLQKFAIRNISNAKYNAHTDPLFRTHTFLKVSDIHELNLLKFYYKYKNNMLPVYFTDMFEHTHATHTYNTRIRDQPRQIYPSTTSAEKSIRYTIPNVINRTPTCITNKINTHSINGFSEYIKKLMCDKYNKTCGIANCYVCNSP